MWNCIHCMEVTRSQSQSEGVMYKCLTFSIPTAEINTASKTSTR